MAIRDWFRRSEEHGLTETQLIDLAFGFVSLSNGFNVTQSSAFKSNAVLACLIVRAETFAALPAHVYRQSGKVRERVDDPLEVLIGGFANPMQTSREFWRWKQITEDVRGRAYVWVERRAGQPIALWPMTNTDMVVSYDAVAREPVYKYGGDSIVKAGTYLGRDVLHFRGPLVKDAWEGTSLVDQAKTAIGLTINSELFYDRLLNKGAHFPGHLETDAALKKEDIQALAEQFEAFAGVDHAGELRIFDRGLKYIQNQMSIKDADLTAQMTWYLQEVCRVFRVPPPLVQDWSRSTYTNSEQADLWFAKHTIMPIATNTEATLNRLFVRRNTPDRYVKFELDGLMRGDFKGRAEGYALLINSRVMNPNEARAFEDLNPYEGGDSYNLPLNTALVDPDDGTITNPNDDSMNDPSDTPDDSPSETIDDGRAVREGKVLSARNFDKVIGARDLLDEVLSEAEGRGMTPMLADAIDRVRRRVEQDAGRDRDQRTREFALSVMEPAAKVLGFPLDRYVDALIGDSHE